MPQDDVDVLNKVLEEESGGKTYTVVTDHGDIEFGVKRVDRARRQEFIGTLPDGLVEYMHEQADDVRQREDVQEISSLSDIEDGAPDDAPSDSMLTGTAVREMEDLIVEAFYHSQITDGELRDLMEHWPDKMFYITSFLILAISAEDGGVTDFRTE